MGPRQVSPALRELARRYNAVICYCMADVGLAPKDRFVAFETRNFGWILSPDNEAGHRTITRKE